jgi:hypothetical protein
MSDDLDLIGRMTCWECGCIFTARSTDIPGEFEKALEEHVALHIAEKVQDMRIASLLPREATGGDDSETRRPAAPGVG